MTEAERNELGLIQQHESGGRNVMNYIGDRTHTAQGYYQITNTNWRRLAPRLGITAPNAMSATLEEQTRVALALRRQSGMGNWTRYNPSLRGAIGRGDRAPAGATRPEVGPAPAQRELRATLNVNLDGRRVASVVSRHQFDAANRPATAANFSDASEMFPQVG